MIAPAITHERGNDSGNQFKNLNEFHVHTDISNDLNAG
jgi:hypothetical protein